ncbi:hypothetical protein EDD66_105303 [Mobilisporobacter senegalensis]|uniref:YqbQ/XkdQ domain-containing protein n=1 Tax=Mobilisporobacter senegalensis TaxID=1329262 RepID=A0A3N1XQB5_9FIRM|nr:hypothetical protein [Mobilisporobacter senegalensis]ROR28361.1 hypothetical protein EDD66_105303 [Mobilisporobacter senegalensis]
MKIKWVKQSDGSVNDITDFVSTINWGGSAGQASRTLDISVLNSPFDKNISDPNINLGDRIRLYYDDSRLLIDIMVYNRERNNETGTITYSGYDDLNHLLRSNGSYNFKNVTPEMITKKICNELKIETGTIAATNVNIKSMLIDSSSYYDIILKAYTKAHKMNGKKYMPIMSGRKLYVIEKGEIIKDFILSDEVNILSSSYTESLDSMVNQIKIYDDKGKQIGEVKNDDWVKQFGIFQDIYTKEDGENGTKAAKNMLVGIDKTASLQAIGNISCISGFGIAIYDSLTGLKGTFWIEQDSHSFENGNHTMNLDLTFKNIMEVKE